MNFSQNFLCSACGENIYDNSVLRVVCAECVPVVDLCLDCYASRVEIGQHKNSHSYRLADNGDLIRPLDDDWSGKELIQLLEGLEQFGHGNWNDVARYVETKEPNECKEAVNNMFVEGPIGQATFDESERGIAIDHTQGSSAVVSSASVEEPNGDANKEISIHELILLGYMPARGDFEIEQENCSEELVSGLQDIQPSLLSSEDSEEVEQALHLTHVEMYQHSLREREQRKKVVKQYGLVEAFFKENPINPSTGKLATPKPRKKDPRLEVFEKVKPLSRFQSVEEYKKLTASLTKEKDLKQRIKELIRYRKNGLTALNETESYEAQRVRRNRKKAERKKAQEGGSSQEAGSSSTGSLTSIDDETKPDLDKTTSIVGLPGYDLMSVNEKRLCTSLRLHPNLYLSYKTCLLRDHLSKKKGQIPKPVHPSGLDKVHRKKIFNFLLHSGWISAY